jgi:hypothetical protein
MDKPHQVLHRGSTCGFPPWMRGRRPRKFTAKRGCKDILAFLGTPKGLKPRKNG